MRGLIIGIDAYQYYKPLKGAVADARDIESALRNVGTKDVVTLIDAAADRAGVIREMDRLVTRTQANDLVLLSIAGHGAQEPERVKGSEPDGMENVFLLPGFQPSPTGSQQRVLGREFNHFIKQLEFKGARVVFVADTCHGGGMVRDIDPRAEEMSFRQVPSYRLTADLLTPVTTSTETYLTELDFDRTDFLAAVDRRTKAPEVSIPGVQGLRGALSYSIARAIEGNADADGNGIVTVKELFTNVRQVVYQLSNQRQNIVTVSSPSRNPDSDVVFQYRGISVVGVAEGRTTVTPPQPQQPQPLPPVVPASPVRPVKIAALDNNRAHFTGVNPRDASVEVVAPIDNPDIIWDPKSRDVISWGDVVAYQIDKTDLASVIERTAAVRELKQMAIKAPQVIKIGPNDSLHRNQSMIQVEVSGRGRARGHSDRHHGRWNHTSPLSRPVRCSDFADARFAFPGPGGSTIRSRPDCGDHVLATHERARTSHRPAPPPSGCYAGDQNDPTLRAARCADRLSRAVYRSLGPIGATGNDIVPDATRLFGRAICAFLDLSAGDRAGRRQLAIGPHHRWINDTDTAAVHRKSTAVQGRAVGTRHTTRFAAWAQRRRPRCTRDIAEFGAAERAAWSSAGRDFSPGWTPLSTPSGHGMPVVANPAELSIEMLPETSIAIGSRVSFRISAKKPGYLILVDVDSTGKLTQIYPSPASLMAGRGKPNANFVKPGKPIQIPSPLEPYAGFEFVASPPPGTAMVVAILCDQSVQMVDLPDIPGSLAGQTAALALLSKLAGELRIPSARYDEGRLQRPTWSLSARFYEIRQTPD